MTAVFRKFMAAAVLVSGVLATASMVFAGQGEDLFARAVKQYQSGDYAGAVEFNERLLKEQGLQSSALYFNLGNSCFKRGDLGHAILAYLRARRIAPRDADIRQNLSFARQSVERYEQERSGHEDYFLIRVFRSLSADELKWLVALAFMGTGAVFLAGLYVGLPFKRVALFTGALAAVTVFFFTVSVMIFIDSSGGAVVLSKSEARFEPTVQATVYFNVSEGEELRIIRQKEDWVKVQREDGRQGWIAAKAVEAI
jgi:hypothetical protein